MKLYEYMTKKNMDALSYDEKVFVSRIFWRETRRIALTYGFKEEDVFNALARGEFGFDRELDLVAEMDGWDRETDTNYPIGIMSWEQG